MAKPVFRKANAFWLTRDSRPDMNDKRVHDGNIAIASILPEAMHDIAVLLTHQLLSDRNW
jgi:hypothetical protein